VTAGATGLWGGQVGLGVCAVAVSIGLSGCGAGRPPATPGPPPLPAPATVEQRDQGLSDTLAALAQQPTVESHLAAATEYRRLGVLDKAYDHLTAAIGLAPHDGALFDARARVWRDWGLPQFALGDAARAVYFAPSSPASENTLGTVLVALGNLDEAAASFRAALALDPHAAYAMNNLCYVSFLKGDLTGATGQCRDAAALDPDLAAARNNLALVYAASDRLTEAQQEFLKAGGTANGHYNMGIVYMARRDYAKAAAAFDAALKEQPSLTDAAARARQARLLLAQAGKK
jgi:tetratricopeptide (TPR) repeat protein